MLCFCKTELCERAAVCFGQIYSIASACISSPVTLKDSPLLCAEESAELTLVLQETINSMDFEHLRAIVLVPFWWKPLIRRFNPWWDLLGRHPTLSKLWILQNRSIPSTSWRWRAAWWGWRQSGWSCFSLSSCLCLWSRQGSSSAHCSCPLKMTLQYWPPQKRRQDLGEIKMREKISFMPPWPPQRRRKIPPELTNRYVKDEAFIVVYRRILKITTKAANNLFCCDYFFIPTVAAHQRPHLSCQLSVWPRVSQQHL